MMIVNQPIYVVISHGMKNGKLTISLCKTHALDRICAIEIPVSKFRMLDPNLVHLLRWYLPDNLPPCELLNLQSQIVIIRDKLIKLLFQSLDSMRVELRNP